MRGFKRHDDTHPSRNKSFAELIPTDLRTSFLDWDLSEHHILAGINEHIAYLTSENYAGSLHEIVDFLRGLMALISYRQMLTDKLVIRVDGLNYYFSGGLDSGFSLVQLASVRERDATPLFRQNTQHIFREVLPRAILDKREVEFKYLSQEEP